MAATVIVTADDYGIDSFRDGGILAGVAAAAISSVSVIVNGNSCCAATLESLLAYKSSASIGLHLNLTEFHSVAAKEYDHEIVHLIDRDGRMHGKHGFRKFLAEGRIPRSELVSEIRSQFIRFRELTGGITPCHVDGHQHVHVLPLVREVLAEVMCEMGVFIVRMPLEDLNQSLEKSVLSESLSFYHSVVTDALCASSTFLSKGIFFPHAFIGMSCMGSSMTIGTLARLLASTIDNLGRFSDGAEHCEFHRRLFRHHNLPDIEAGWSCKSCRRRPVTIEVMTHVGLPDANGHDDFSRSPERLHEFVTILQWTQMSLGRMENVVAGTTTMSAPHMVRDLHVSVQPLSDSGSVVLLCPSSTEATGNWTTLQRLSDIFRRLGLATQLLSVDRGPESIMSECTRLNVDVVVGIHLFKTGPVALEVARASSQALKKPVRTVMILGGSDINVPQDEWMGPMIDVMAGSDAVIAFTFDMFCRAFVTYGPSVLQKVQIIPQTVNVSTEKGALDVTIELHRIIDVLKRDSRHIVVCCGGIRPVKGQLEMIDAFVNSDDGDNGVSVVCVGPVLDRSYMSCIQSVLDSSASPPQVHIVPACTHKQLLTALSHCDTLVNWSVNEGQSASLLEAMAAEIPVVARENTGNVGLIRNNYNGVFFREGKQGVRMLHQGPVEKEHREALAAMARRVVAICHSEELELDRYSELFSLSTLRSDRPR